MTLRRSIRCMLGAVAASFIATLFSAEASAQCRVEPLGDSITAGWGSTLNPGYPRGPGYRWGLAVVPPVYGLSFVGARDDTVPETIPVSFYPYSTYDGGAGPWAQPYHSGVPGWRADELKAVVSAGYFLKPTGAAPNMVLVHAGTNDFIQGATSAAAAARLHDLLAAVAVKYPYATTKIIAAQIVPFGYGWAWLNPQVAAYNAALPATVAALNAAYGPRFYIADMNTGFPATSLNTDGIHPTNDGYLFMAGRWAVVMKMIAPLAGCVAT